MLLEYNYLYENVSAVFVFLLKSTRNIDKTYSRVIVFTFFFLCLSNLRAKLLTTKIIEDNIFRGFEIQWVLYFIIHWH